MYYLIKPDTTVLWSDASEFMIQRLQKDHPELDIDLRRLDWQPAERWFDAGLLNTALRYGIKVADGIVVSGQASFPWTTSATWKPSCTKKSNATPPMCPTPASWRPSCPAGPTKPANSTTASSNHSERRSSAQREMLAAFSKPIDPALFEHWQNLGGSIPTQPPTA
jgi:hypothetical protein